MRDESAIVFCLRYVISLTFFFLTKIDVVYIVWKVLYL